MRELLEHMSGAVSAASEAQGAAVRMRFRRSPEASSLGRLGLLAERLASARHSPAPLLDRKVAVLVAADHGIAHPGIELGANNPTAVALQHIASGRAAVNSASRSVGAELVLVDVGVRGGEEHDLGPGILRFRLGDDTGDIRTRPAMSLEVAAESLQTGIALLYSLADAGLDVLALGQIAAGSQPVSAALVAALCGEPAAAVADSEDVDAVEAALARYRNLGAPAAAPAERALGALAELGGHDLGVLAGLILGAASQHLPILLDGHGTSAAAIVAVHISPAVGGYLFAAHGGSCQAHRSALAGLELEPLFELGLAHGEGTGALLAMPMLEAASRLLRDLS